MYKLLDLFGRANNGKYDESLVGKLANFGDKAYESKYYKPIRSVTGFISEKWAKLVSKSKALTALTKMPTLPENCMAKDMIRGTREQLVNEYVALIEKNIGSFNTKNATFDESVAYSKKLSSEYGIKNMRLWSKIKNFANLPVKEQESVLKSIITSCDKVGSTKSATLSNTLGVLTNRKVNFEQIGNQIKSISQAKTSLGRFLAKAPIRGLYGLTFGGGFWMLLTAFTLAKAIPTTHKAEKGDKISTFADEFLGNISWVITFPLAGKIMNAVGGLKYLGLPFEKLQEYRKKLAIHNSTKFSSKEAWKTSKDALDAMRNSEKIGFFNKILRGIGKFIGAGREVIMPYVKQGQNLSNWDKFKNLLAKIKGKGLIAYPIGFISYLLVFGPMAEKLFETASHAVFGKPKRLKDAENKEQKIEPQNNNVIANEPSQTQTEVPQSPTNLLNMHQNGQTYNSSPVIETENKDNYTYIPSTNPVKTEGASTIAPVRTYVPSSEGVKVAPLDPTLANQAMSRADAAEKMALEALAMK